MRLTGENTVDIYDAAAFIPYFDVHSQGWVAELSSLVAPVQMMPRPTWTCEVAGRVTAEAARATGLATGTPVITGTADAAAEAISAGLTDVGDLMVMYGSSTFFILLTKELLAMKRFWGGRFLSPDTYMVAGGTATAGSLTRWFRDEFGHPEMANERAGGQNAYEALASLASSSPLGARGLLVLPYFSGERTPLHDPYAKGMFFGLTLSHTRSDIYRGILESVGYSIRHNIDALGEEGCRPSRILAVGGGTRNPFWMQIVSNIAGIRQLVPEQQIGASFGDAFLAGVGVGLFSDLKHVSRWVRLKEPVQPDPAAQKVYDDFYRLYLELYTRNAAAMRELSTLAYRDAPTRTTEIR
jgi:xylulokinase